MGGAGEIAKKRKERTEEVVSMAMFQVKRERRNERGEHY